MSAINTTAIKRAIRTWVLRGSGLADDKVIWTLGGRVPEGTYIHLRLKFSTIGTDFVNNIPNPNPTPGNDAIYRVLGSRLATLTVTCFGHDDYNSGDRSPESILNDVLTAASLPSMNAVINAAKIGALRFSDPTTVDVAINTVEFEPRAYVIVTFHTIARLEETGPSIDSVEVHGDYRAEPADDSVVIDSVDLDIDSLLSP